jgi:hypothetical protein
MGDGQKSFEFTIDKMDSLSIKNNWCSWCVNVFVSDQTGDWISCGTGLLTFQGRKKNETSYTKVSSVRDLKNVENEWEPGMFSLQVKSRRNLSSNNKAVQIDNELRRKLSMGGGEDVILNVELRRATQCNLSELVIMWFQSDAGEHLALSFLSAVAIIESWEILCHITGTSMQDSFKVELGYLDYILKTLEAKEEDIIKKKLTVAVFCSKVAYD